MSFEYYKYTHHPNHESYMISPLNFTLNRFFGKKKGVYVGWTAGFSIIEAHNKSTTETNFGTITTTTINVTPSINTSLYVGTQLALTSRLSVQS